MTTDINALADLYAKAADALTAQQQEITRLRAALRRARGFIDHERDQHIDCAALKDGSIPDPVDREWLALLDDHLARIDTALAGTAGDGAQENHDD